MNTVLQSMTALINSEENVEKLETLMNKVSEGGIIIDTTQIRSIYGGNMQWQNQYFQQIDEWFENQSTSTTATTETTVTETTVTETTVTETTVTETTVTETTVTETTVTETTVTETTVTETTVTEQPTTQPTPNNANSIVLSLALFTVCLIFNL